MWHETQGKSIHSWDKSWRPSYFMWLKARFRQLNSKTKYLSMYRTELWSCLQVMSWSEGSSLLAMYGPHTSGLGSQRQQQHLLFAAGSKTSILFYMHSYIFHMYQWLFFFFTENRVKSEKSNKKSLKVGAGSFNQSRQWSTERKWSFYWHWKKTTHILSSLKQMMAKRKPDPFARKQQHHSTNYNQCNYFSVTVVQLDSNGLQLHYTTRGLYKESLQHWSI